MRGKGGRKIVTTRTQKAEDKTEWARSPKKTTWGRQRGLPSLDKVWFLF